MGKRKGSKQGVALCHCLLAPPFVGDVMDSFVALGLRVGYLFLGWLENMTGFCSTHTTITERKIGTFKHLSPRPEYFCLLWCVGGPNRRRGIIVLM